MVPAPLSHDSALVLEYESLREMLLAYAASPLGKARIRGLAPSHDLQWIEHQQQLTSEIREYLRAGHRFEFGGGLDPAARLKKAAIQGAALEPAEISDVITVVDRAAEWRETALHPPSDLKQGWPAVAALSSAIADFTLLLRFFRNKILPDGTLDDRASPELGRIRRDVEKQKRLIQDWLRGYVHRLAEGEVAQDELVTIRGERFVIPVKVEQKRKVQGVVHGASSTGQTVYIEPLETIEQNNELVRLLEGEQAEVHRILVEMTARLAAEAVPITVAVDALAEIEFQFAKARFAEDYACLAPRFQSRDKPRRLLLHKVRHPVLERNLKLQGRPIVPLSLELDNDHFQVVISGPNTGGKTVALKTIGLLALMAQSGVPVLAERADLSLFDAVLADIGDYQSLEQNLSTFSSHITNIDHLSRTATRESLVLLDELGSATDPHEGAALAVAIAEHFRRLAAITVVSTHHTALKVYAAGTDGVLNAAVGFDEQTLQPTYELRVGIPGPSAGINIAQRLGLNPQIIAAARERLSGEAQEISRFLDRLHGELREAEGRRADLELKARDLEAERELVAREGRKEQRAKIRELEKKLDSLLSELEYQARQAVRGLEDRSAAAKLGREAERRVARLRREFREQFDSAVVAHRTGADVGDSHARLRVTADIHEGDTVKLKSLGRTGIVRRRFDADTFEVEVGALRTKVSRDDVADVISAAGLTPVQAARARGISVSVDESLVPAEINVIGRTVDEATREVEKFVDRAFLSGLPRVRIVHGTGLGKLRKALREYLKQHPHVASVAEPPQQEGGAGATVVELRS